MSPSRPVRTEWPTVLLALAIHTGWLAVTWAHAALPSAVLMLCGGWLVAWHGSLQHETIHGHPTRWRWVNMMIGSVPLALWLPYGAYRRSHIAHHRTGQVTDPFDDPESRYLSERRGPLSGPRRLVARIQAPLIGRLLLGPAIIIPAFLMREAKRLGADPASTLADWAPHGLGVAAVLAWLHVCGLGLTDYLCLFVYPGTALSLLRSYVEHRANTTPGHRVAIVEGAGPFALLYLHNNLHAAHHDRPGLAWYRLPAFHRRHRRRLLADNGGLLYRSYGEILRRFLFHAHDHPVHPDHRPKRAS